MFVFYFNRIWNIGLRNLFQTKFKLRKLKFILTETKLSFNASAVKSDKQKLITF